MTASLHQLALYYRDHGLVGEDRAALTTTVALAGGASVIVRGQSGTGKSHLADIAAGLYPAEKTAVVDMMSDKAIWSKGAVERITQIGDDGLVYFPEDQNAADNDEVVKVKKKWGDLKEARREKSENYGNDTSVTVLPVRKFLSTAALSNEAHAKTFDAESARRVIKVPTSPASSATRAVLGSMAEGLVVGEGEMRVLNPMERRKIEKHAHAAFMRGEITRVRFFGARALADSVPDTFPEARSAFNLFKKVLLGTARWYAEREVIQGDTVYLTPSTVAEAWAFYGDYLLENALKLDTMDRDILGAFPQPAWNGSAVTPESCLDINAVMKTLRPKGITDPGFVKAQIARLIMKGFLVDAEGFRTSKWHRTGIADFVNIVDWTRVIEECRTEAPRHLEGEALETYLAAVEKAAGPEAIQNPMTGQIGPLVGEESVLYFNESTGKYTPVGKDAGQGKTGLFAFAEASA